MAIQPQTPGIHHIALRVNDFARTKAFYQDLLGFPMVLETPELMGCLLATVFLGFKLAAPPDPANRTFTPFNVGLDHPKALRRLQRPGPHRLGVLHGVRGGRS